MPTFKKGDILTQGAPPMHLPCLIFSGHSVDPLLSYSIWREKTSVLRMQVSGTCRWVKNLKMQGWGPVGWGMLVEWFLNFFEHMKFFEFFWTFFLTKSGWRILLNFLARVGWELKMWWECLWGVIEDALSRGRGFRVRGPLLGVLFATSICGWPTCGGPFELEIAAPIKWVRNSGALFFRVNRTPSWSYFAV